MGYARHCTEPYNGRFFGRPLPERRTWWVPSARRFDEHRVNGQTAAISPRAPDRACDIIEPADEFARNRENRHPDVAIVGDLSGAGSGLADAMARPMDRAGRASPDTGRGWPGSADGWKRQFPLR